MALLTVSGINKTEKGNLVVKNVSFTQQPSQKIAIAGATGSGKTTLLKMIASLIQPDSGTIYFESEKVAGPIDQLLPGHKGIAYLSQHFELRNNYRVQEILEMANKLSDEDAQNIYDICQIEHLLKRRTDAISGGERQRIALAGLLTTSPKLLLLDEPFSNLDMMHKSVIKNVIEAIGSKLNITCMMVSHDALDILSWADRILIMKDGAIIQDATPQQVYYKPINEYTAGLLGTYNILDGSLATGLGIELQGNQIIVRPEQFGIATTDDHMLAGTVQHKLFLGSYFTVDVLVKDKIITIRTNNHTYMIGDTIYLNVTLNTGSALA